MTGSIVIPEDILTETFAQTAKEGWYAGFKILHENVRVVFSLGEGEHETATQYVDRIRAHRAVGHLSGRYSNQIAKWMAVAPGSIEKVKGHLIFKTSDLEGIIQPTNKPLAQPAAPIILVEIGNDSHTAAAFSLAIKDEFALIFPVELIRLGPDPNSLARLPLAERSRLQKAKVTLAGAGSGGGEIALGLAAAGVGNLTIFDPDIIQPENYFRHACGAGELGRLKVRAVASAISDRELPCHVETRDDSVTAWADKFRGELDESHLIVCATDTVGSRRFLNMCSILRTIPLVIAGTFDSGRIGEVMLVRPGAGPCYECMRSGLGAALEPVDAIDAQTPYIGSESSALESSALRSDVAAVAAIAVRASLAALDPEQFPQLPADYILWGREAQSTYSPPFQFDLPLTVKYVQLQRSHGCPVCGDEAVASRNVGVTEEYEHILSLARTKADK